MERLLRGTYVGYMPLMSFYFEYQREGKTKMADMLRLFIVQLLDQDNSALDHLQKKILPADPSQLHSVSWLQETVLDVILAQKHCHIIIDGLDECELGQQKDILMWLLEKVVAESKAQGVCLNILVSGQRNGILDRLLSTFPAIRLDNQVPHLRDITIFSSVKLAQIRKEFPEIDEDEDISAQLNAEKIAKASNGMAECVLRTLDVSTANCTHV